MKNYKDCFFDIDYISKLDSYSLSTVGYILLEKDVYSIDGLGIVVEPTIENIVVNNCIMLVECGPDDNWILEGPDNERYKISDITKRIFKNLLLNKESK